VAAHVQIYTRRLCGYCFAAERLLSRKGVAYEQIDATGNPELRKWLAAVTGRTTVPQVFIDGKPIGGYDDLQALDRSGALDAMLAGTAPA
jgi:glutaredoxin 3